jgi:hypothetical protein
MDEGQPVIQFRVAMLAPSASRSSSMPLITFLGPMLAPIPSDTRGTKIKLGPMWAVG